MAMSPRLLRPLASGFNPKSLGTLALWLDGADRSRMFSDDAGTTLSADDGQVAVYKEKANGYNLAQTIANNRPLVRSNTKNGRSVLEFDGSNDALISPALVENWAALTAFAVFNLTSTVGNAAVGRLFQRTSRIWFRNTDSLTFFFDGLGTPLGSSTGAGSVTNNNWFNANVNHNGGGGPTDAPQRLNGTAVGAGSGTVTPPSVANAEVFIGNRSGNDRPFPGYIAEMMIYSQSLSAAAVLKAEGYLAWKWGMQSQLPYDHPYAKSFPGFGSQTTPTDSDTLTYLAAVKAADGEGVEVSVANAVDDFVTGCKADGIWDAIEASCILAGARTLAGALVPLKGAAPTNNGPFVTGDYNRETGLIGNGSTKFLNSNRNCNADAQNSHHLAVYASALDSNAGAIGVHAGAGGSGVAGSTMLVEGVASPGALRGRSRSGTLSSAAFNEAVGFLAVGRSSSAALVLRTSDSSSSQSVTSDTALNANYFVFSTNSAGSALNLFNGRLAYYSIGESLDLALLDARVSALVTAFGAAI